MLPFLNPVGEAESFWREYRRRCDATRLIVATAPASAVGKVGELLQIAGFRWRDCDVAQCRGGGLVDSDTTDPARYCLEAYRCAVTSDHGATKHRQNLPRQGNARRKVSA